MLLTTTPVDLTVLTFPALKMRASDAGKLRGYFAQAFGESVLFHNHTADQGFRYGYSLIQYKVLRGVPTVLGVSKGARLVMDAFMDVNELVIANQTVSVDSKELEVARSEAGIVSALHEFRFATPLFAFNQDNYALFKRLPDSDLKGFLTKIITSHLITALRGIGCEVNPASPILVSHRLRPCLVTVKNQRMQMYTGTFTANVVLPPKIGIGKSTSKGFGTIVPL